MTSDRDRERDRDVEFGKLVEAVNTLQREAAQKREEDQKSHQALVEMMAAMQKELHSLRAAKSMAAWLTVTLIGMGSVIVEIWRTLRGH